ncbi:hypothetical protein BHU72_10850 [Desulfuribacillus stibiiarsenatis]|uniref:Molybdenum hydroxylase n=1 Tax=Desulfuribacillus stibiiarsenatis TaxID=1390249 RepID=A0A1E5L2H2_9FIRM|nr:selenium-dependent molybdenum cofactor biosynthesis protein YqeB [Desulfuribacillus stibiiarsenatis]OEH84304.1 hypothetical protein BHU72_10850 [Desulfuribacillus stibiiarsenatis]
MGLFRKKLIVIRGGGDIATGVAHRLHMAGFSVMILEIPKPTMIRRTVSFAQAVYDGSITIEQVTAKLAFDCQDVISLLNNRHIPILIDEHATILRSLPTQLLASYDLHAVVDATLSKRSLGLTRQMAPIVIGIGPGYTAGQDVHAVIETNRGHYLGKVIYNGTAQADTKVPGDILGYSVDRVLRAPHHGTFYCSIAIGSQVAKGQTIGYVDNTPVISLIDGMLRGVIYHDINVVKGMKIADVDPRSQEQYCYTISDKARAVAGGLLEAILYLTDMP